MLDFLLLDALMDRSNPCLLVQLIDCMPVGSAGFQLSNVLQPDLSPWRNQVPPCQHFQDLFDDDEKYGS